MGKGSFILYDADLKSLSYLTDAQAGKLFKTIAKYRLDGTEPIPGKNVAVNILMQQIIEHISLNEDKYKVACEKKSKTMKKRWNEKKNIENNSILYSSIEEGCSVSDNENDSDNDNENDNVNENVACGAKRENKRKNYYDRKNNIPTLLRDEPAYDIDAFNRKAIGLKYEKKELK